MEDELFSPGAPAPDNERYRATNPDSDRAGMYPGYGAIAQLQAVADSTRMLAIETPPREK